MDAVITWVDGNDPHHKKKRLAAMYSNPKRIDQTSNAVVETRFNDSGEIYFTIASILKFAPFIQRIFIVTDGQTPAHLASFAECGICDAEKIRIVDHTEIFREFEHDLPTFNSLSIETMMYFIDDLSDEFIYFNDDFFLDALFNGMILWTRITICVCLEDGVQPKCLKQSWRCVGCAIVF